MLFEKINVIDENYELKKEMYIETDGKKIVYIGLERPADYKGETYDGRGKTAAPGMFNIHCHVPMVMLRGHGEGLPLDRWLTEKMFPFEALLTSDDMYWGTLLGAAEMIAGGVASFSDMYMREQGILEAVDESGIKANLCNGAASAIGSTERFRDNSAYTDTQYLVATSRTLGHDRIVADMGIHAEYTSDTAMIRDIVEYTAEHKLRMQVHLSETKKEHEEAKVRRGMTAAKWFESLGVFSAPTIAAHCVWLEAEDFEILKRNKVTVAHCPSSNLKLGSGIAKVDIMRQKGINVGIGTDGAASNNNLNMLEEVNLATMVQKGATRDPLFLSISETFKMATRNGATAQGREDCGAIKVGNRADIVVYSMDSPHMTPATNILSNIIYSAQSSDIILNMVDGKVLYKNGEFLTIDIEKAKAEVRGIVKENFKTLGEWEG